MVRVTSDWSGAVDSEDAAMDCLVHEGHDRWSCCILALIQKWKLPHCYASRGNPATPSCQSSCDGSDGDSAYHLWDAQVQFLEPVAARAQAQRFVRMPTGCLHPSHC